MSLLGLSVSDKKVLLESMEDGLGINLEQTALAWNTAVTVCDDLKCLLTAFGAEEKEINGVIGFQQALRGYGENPINSIDQHSGAKIIDTLIETADSCPTLERLGIHLKAGNKLLADRDVLAAAYCGEERYEYGRAELFGETPHPPISTTLYFITDDFFGTIGSNVKAELNERGVSFAQQTLWQTLCDDIMVLENTVLGSYVNQTRGKAEAAFDKELTAAVIEAHNGNITDRFLAELAGVQAESAKAKPQQCEQ